MLQLKCENGEKVLTIGWRVPVVEKRACFKCFAFSQLNYLWLIKVKYATKIWSICGAAHSPYYLLLTQPQSVRGVSWGGDFDEDVVS